MNNEMSSKSLRKKMFNAIKVSIGDRHEIKIIGDSVDIATRGNKIDLNISFSFRSKGSYSLDFGGYFGVDVKVIAIDGIVLPDVMETMVQYASQFTDVEIERFYSVFSSADSSLFKIFQPHGMNYVRKQYWNYPYKESAHFDAWLEFHSQYINGFIYRFQDNPIYVFPEYFR